MLWELAIWLTNVFRVAALRYLRYKEQKYDYFIAGVAISPKNG
jgi:hypothetical protein